MYWKTVGFLKEALPPPEGYEWDHLAQEEVPELVDSLARWFPEVAESGERCHLTVSFYQQKTQLKGVEDDRRILPVVIKQERRLVALTTLEKDRDDLCLTIRMSVVDPQHRGRGLGRLGPLAAEVVGKAIGAELVYYFTTLRIPHEQRIAEKAGFQLVGILPASD